MKKFKIISFCVLLVVIVTGVLFLSSKSNKKEKEKKEEKQVNETNYIVNESSTNNNNVSNRDNIVSENKVSELPEIPKSELIKGIVEFNHDGKIFMFNGQHFGQILNIIQIIFKKEIF